MRFLLPLILMSVSLPSYGQMTNNEKAAWTGGYLYGFAASLCQAKSLGFINKQEFDNLSKKVVIFYKDKLEANAYSPVSSPKLYELQDGNKLNQICDKFWFELIKKYFLFMKENLLDG